MDRESDERTDGWTDRWTESDEQTDGWMKVGQMLRMYEGWKDR